MRLFKDADFHFLESRRAAYALSGVLLLVGMVSLLFHGGLSYGVEFTGGTLMQVEFETNHTVGELRDALTRQGVTGTQIQGFGSENEFIIRAQNFEAAEAGGQDAVENLRAALDSAFGEENYQVVRTAAVGPKVGSELQTKAAYAILMAFALTLIYLAFRFEWRFGVAAVIATFHDILLTFGFLSVMDIEITLGTVAAILTIVGYSLNDTIVTFDRVRENQESRRRPDYIELLNRSINEVLPRTVMTSVTTLVTLGALAVFGGRVIRPFAVVLILGVVVGTYSSIYVASPVLLEIENYLAKRGGARA